MEINHTDGMSAWAVRVVRAMGYHAESYGYGSDGVHERGDDG